MVKHILITGASGLIGRRLTEQLIQKGYSVSHVGRSRRQARVRSFVWDINRRTMEPGTLKGVTTIIHLAGASVAEKRWTEQRKKEILDSRTKSSALLYDELKKGQPTVTSVISASAIGYYGIDNNEIIYTEQSPNGKDFLAEVTKQWEDEVEKIRLLNIRVTKLRIGIVLSNEGGTLKELAKPIQLFAGAPLGSGDQYLSWIHIDDLCSMFIKAVEDENVNGVYNATGPYPVTNRELTKALARVLKRPLILPFIPGFVLRLLLGEMAEIVLAGSKVSSEKIQKAGFVFQFNKLEEALKNLYSK